MEHEHASMEQEKQWQLGQGIKTSRLSFVLIAAYLSAIVLANLLVAWLGPSITIVNAFLFIGLDLTCRDSLHDAWGGNGLWWKMLLLLAAGSAISYLLNQQAGQIAVASMVAFGAAGAADGVVYHLLRKRSWWQRANGSNLVGAAVDSLVFPTIAFGVLLWPIVIGQFAAKVAGGLLWSAFLNRREKN